MTAVVGRTAGSRPAASGGEVVSARRVVGCRGAEASAVLASTVATTAATVSGPAGVTVVVFVGVSQVSGVGTAVCRASVVSGSGGATVVRSSVSGTAVGRWSRGSSVMRPSVSRGPREIWTSGAPMVWRAVSLSVGASRTTEGCVCRASVVCAGLTESRNAVRGVSVCRRSVESRTAVVRGTGVVWSSVSDTRQSRTTVGGSSCVTSGAESGCSVSETTVGRSCVIAEAAVRDVPVRKHSDVSGTMVSRTGVGCTRSSGERARRGGRGISVGRWWTVVSRSYARTLLLWFCGAVDASRSTSCGAGTLWHDV